MVILNIYIYIHIWSSSGKVTMWFHRSELFSREGAVKYLGVIPQIIQLVRGSNNTIYVYIVDRGWWGEKGEHRCLVLEIKGFSKCEAVKRDSILYRSSLEKSSHQLIVYRGIDRYCIYNAFRGTVGILLGSCIQRPLK